MTLAIPAEPGTHVAFENGDTLHVVGWLVHPGGIASPITLEEITEDYVAVIPSEGGAVAKTAAPAAPKATAAPKAAKAPEAPARATQPADGPVCFTGKVYAKKTFWHVHLGSSEEAVFEVEGGDPSPDLKASAATVTKITRVEFFEGKKNHGLYEGGSAEEPETLDAEDDGEDLI